MFLNDKIHFSNICFTFKCQQVSSIITASLRSWNRHEETHRWHWKFVVSFEPVVWLCKIQLLYCFAFYVKRFCIVYCALDLSPVFYIQSIFIQITQENHNNNNETFLFMRNKIHGHFFFSQRYRNSALTNCYPIFEFSPSKLSIQAWTRSSYVQFFCCCFITFCKYVQSKISTFSPN